MLLGKIQNLGINLQFFFFLNHFFLNPRNTTWRAKAHESIVKGVVVTSQGDGFLSCGDDSSVKLWKVDFTKTDPIEPSSYNTNVEPFALWLGKGSFSGIDVQRQSTAFATSSSVVDLWDLNR